MRKKRHTKQYIKVLSCLLAMIIGFLHPSTVMAVEQTDQISTKQAEQEIPDETVEEETVEDKTGENAAEDLKYIMAFESLQEEDAYFSCMYKPSLEELLSAFPETLFVQLEEEVTAELHVTWESEDDFDETELALYTFNPKWDESEYAIADSVKDSIEIPFITVEVPSDDGMIRDLEEARNDLKNLVQKKSILALVYLCDKYEVKNIASEDGQNVVAVVSGQSVQIIDVELDEYGYVWYQVLLYQNGTEYKGYIEKDYLATSDEDFAEWEEEYIDLSTMPMMMAVSAGYPDIDQFPASYQNALYALKEKHPNWIFVRMNTGLDWNTAIKNELGDKSLVPSSSSGSWQNGTYGQGWSYASEGILKYYMDPRNFLSDPSVFQFEQLTYNSSYHTTGAVQEVLKNSFMSSTIPGDSQTYAQAFTGIGQTLGISPFHLAARVLQEQGVKGTSPIISGSYTGYEGYYNYFNVGASGRTNTEVIVSGLKKAKEQGWNTRYKSLYGGASVVGKNYILKGQDTLYLEKFNVSNGQHANYTHQYMQNIQAPNSEAANIRKAYYNAGALENSFVFKIPVYNNMPASACSKPDTTDAITLDKTTITNLEVNKTAVLTPYVNGSKVDNVNNMTFTSSNTSVAIVDSKGKVTAVSPGTVTISCTRSGANTATCSITVIKTNPNVTTPVLSPVTYQEGLRLSDVVLPDGWAWVKGDTAISAGTVSYPAIYTPSDVTKYNTVTKDISFTVTKSIPSCKVPEKLETKVGLTLESIALPSGFAWESDTEAELTKTGEYTFYVSYNPDENNYYTVNHIPVIVQVTGDISGGNSGADNNTSIGTTSMGSTSTGTTSTGSSSTGSTNQTSANSTVTSNGTTSAGSSSTGSTSTGTTSTGSTGTSTGSTSVNSTSSSSTNTSTGSTSTGTTSTGSTSAGTTSTGSTGTSTGSTSVNSTSSSSTNTSTGSGSTGSTGTSTGNMSVASIDASETTSSTANTDNESSDSASINSATTQSDETTTVIAMQDFVVEESKQEEEAFTKPSVTIQMEDTTILTAEMIQMAKEQNFDLLLDMGNQIRWIIDADSINVESFSAVDMGITIGTNSIPRELIEEILDENKYLEFTLAHDGAFDFSPDLYITLNPEDCGRYANLFYYNSENDTLEFICDSLIDENGVAVFRFEHASSYVIMISDQSMSGLLASDNPENGMAKWIILGVFICMILVVIGYGAFFLWKKKQDNDDEECNEDEEQEEDDDIDESNDEGFLDEGNELDEIEIVEMNESLPDVAEQESSGRESTEEILSEEESSELEAVEIEEANEEDDWIEDEDWKEPEALEKKPVDEFEDDHAENDWIDDDEWDIGNDWIDDDEWAEKNR